ncbi:MAG: ParB/RepB/Spo0J family partition protein [Proteobacteria bacterium]|nr:ParB/RepB/Spo0J family partition protein [Pseudomonadota bacterium]MDA0928190.1 ParB/RepB/Spo0J family partition protein [Pseudomonadota bacterium]
MNDKKKLGKGLDALLSSGSSQTMASLLAGKPREVEVSSGTSVTTRAHDKDGDLRNIPVDLIQRGKYQPRTDMHQEALEELAASIKTQGVMQPIIVRPISSEKYEIIAGERRWRATQMAGLDSIPAIIKPVGDEAAIAMSLIENIQRENLNPIEEAMALKRLQDEFELTQQEVADAVGKSRVTVTNLMRLMGLHIDVRRMLENGDLEMGHARALLGLEDLQQPTAARAVVGRGLSVRQTEALVRRLQAGGAGKKASKILDPDIKNLQDNLEEKLGSKVLIQHTAKGKGKLVVKYNSLDELDGILAHIK